MMSQPHSPPDLGATSRHWAEETSSGSSTDNILCLPLPMVNVDLKSSVLNQKIFLYTEKYLRIITESCIPCSMLTVLESLPLHPL